MKWWDILKVGGRRSIGTVFTLGDKRYRLSPEHVERYKQLLQEYKRFNLKPEDNKRMALIGVIREFNIQAGIR
jgi:hypothetical protein